MIAKIIFKNNFKISKIILSSEKYFIVRFGRADEGMQKVLGEK